MHINTNLEETFNLTHMSDDPSEIDEELELVEETPFNVIQELDKINAGLPLVQGLDHSDAEFDELSSYAISSYKELMDLAMNVEQRFAGEIAGTAATMLGHAITAKTNKAKKKLDMIALQIKKQVADSKKISSSETPELMQGSATLLDRNEILKLLQSPVEDK